MLKKLLMMAMCLLLILAVCGCSSSNQDNDEDTPRKESNKQYSENLETDDNSLETTNKRISGLDIEYASPYSEGLIFLKSANDEIIYCVEKNGTVAFELDAENTNAKDSKFMSGYAFVRVRDEKTKNYYDALCDKEGNLVSPSDVGATEFHETGETLKSGYILATKTVSTYSETKAELGVLNTSFEWVVPLSESLYKEFEDTLGDAYNENFVIDDCFYSVELSKLLNLKTGETKAVKLKKVTPSSEWGVPGSCDGYYRVQSNMLVPEDGQYIDLADNVIRASYFVDGVAPILYQNEDADTYFITLIDESGNHLFEPIQITYAPLTFKLATDGKHLVYTEKSILVCRNTKGEKLGEFDLPTINEAELSMNEGVVSIGNRQKVLCFDSQLNKLF